MKIAYLDTVSGIAGDMTLAALVDAGADSAYLQQQINSLGVPGIELLFSEAHRGGFRALRLDIKHPAEQVHRNLREIERLIDSSKLTDRERDLALRIFRKLGQAEARVHGMPIEQVHFHEVGAIDSIVDIVGVAIAISQMGIERLFASPTPTGTGFVTIAHGTVSVPAPATAELLKGIPIRSSKIEAELTTPTGAAILASLVDDFGPLPAMKLTSIGYGAGHKDLSMQANMLRVLIGDSSDTSNSQDVSSSSGHHHHDTGLSHDHHHSHDHHDHSHDHHSHDHHSHDHHSHDHHSHDHHSHDHHSHDHHSHDH